MSRRFPVCRMSMGIALLICLIAAVGGAAEQCA